MITPLKTDSYKLFHRQMFPDGTQFIQSNLTPRSLKHFQKYLASKDWNLIKISHNLLNYVVTKLYEDWRDNFIDLPWAVIRSEVIKFQDETGIEIAPMLPHYRALHEWCNKPENKGQLPLSILILDDCMVKEKTPIITIRNLEPEFFWLVNYIETWLLSETWPLIVADNIMFQLKECFYQNLTATEFSRLDLRNLCHDFSQRGQSSLESAIKYGIAYLNNFNGTDNLPAMYEWIKYRHLLESPNAKPLRFPDVKASEHNVMMVNGQSGEFEVYQRLIDEFPSGLLSIVSDTFDYWNVLNNYLPLLKDKILARDGVTILRPDSGNPLEIIPQTFAILGQIFGYEEIEGLKYINPKVGVIFGEGLDVKTIETLIETMHQQGWAISNLVFGIGAFLLAYNTRDTLGFAFKTSAVCVDYQWRMVRKEPITDPESLKKSHLGFVNVYTDHRYQVRGFECAEYVDRIPNLISFQWALNAKTLWKEFTFINPPKK